MIVVEPPSAWVLPLGDSNTLRIVWRNLLAQAAVADGKAIHYLGSVNNASDYRNEGHSGYRCTAATADWATWAASHHRHPDYILTMFGTNDINLGSPVPADYNDLIDAIATSHPTALILVSTIPPLPAHAAERTAWNAALPSIVTAKAAAGVNIEYYDACAGIVDADLDGDNVHLSEASGQPKLAANWWARLTLGG